MKIALIGYMAAGKSTIGKALSEKLDIQFFDLDSEIEKRHNRTISEIFNSRGEVFFRKWEHEILQEFFEKTDDFILALGGGTPLYYNNMALVNDHCLSIYLQNNVAILSQRLENDPTERPLIAHLSTEELSEFVAKHLFERDAKYREAHFKITANDKSIATIVEEITRLPPLQNPQ